MFRALALRQSEWQISDRVLYNIHSSHNTFIPVVILFFICFATTVYRQLWFWILLCFALHSRKTNFKQNSGKAFACIMYFKGGCRAGALGARAPPSVTKKENVLVKKF